MYSFERQKPFVQKSLYLGFERRTFSAKKTRIIASVTSIRIYCKYTSTKLPKFRNHAKNNNAV